MKANPAGIRDVQLAEHKAVKIGYHKDPALIRRVQGAIGLNWRSRSSKCFMRSHHHREKVEASVCRLHAQEPPDNREFFRGLS